MNRNFRLLAAALSAFAVAATGVIAVKADADTPKRADNAQSIFESFDDLGFGSLMGSEGELLSPESKVTVSDAVRAVSGIHSYYYNEQSNLSVSGEDIFEYAYSNGIVEEGSYSDYEAYITRYQLSDMLVRALPESEYEAINSVKKIPDISNQDERFDAILMLYNAGVMRGCDEYCHFYGDDSVSLDELSTVVSRAVLPENRVRFEQKHYYEPAAYLIDDESMVRGVRKITYIASGWTYENPMIFNNTDKDYSTNVLGDISNEKHIAIHKDIETLNEGKVVLESIYSVTGPGSRYIFKSLDDKVLFELFHNDETFYFINDVVNNTGFSFVSGVVKLKCFMDFDARTVNVYVNGENIGTYSMTDAADLSKITIATTDEATISVTVDKVFLYRNYHVNDTFRLDEVGTVPFGWTARGDVSLISQNSDRDLIVAQMKDESSAFRSFEKVSDSFVVESYVRVTENQNVSLYLGYDDDVAFIISASNGEFSHNGQLLRKYTNGVWQQIRIEADTNKNTAIIKINGKVCTEQPVPFEADGVDLLVFSTTGEGEFNFDDVLVFNTFDYVDYCPTPVPVNDDDWYSGMSVCSLWREGSHYGWDCIAPYEDLTPVLGYYDEGIPEAMDWEIKFLAEHGYDYQRFCWYYGGYNEHIKKPRLCDNAIHEGYFNAKYSDMLDFTLMWENAGSKGTKEEFYNNIWPYWVDWYFTDPRYFCIDNKPVLTIYSYSAFKKIMGGSDDATVEEQEAGVAECLTFMCEEMVKLGYSGMIVYVSNASGDANLNSELARLGFDAKAAYHFDEPAYDIEYQKLRMNAELDAGSIAFTPSCGIGFNDIGWTETRTPLASPEDFEAILRWSRDYYLPEVARFCIEEWQSKSVMTNTWNEFGEGHYVFPTSLHGFGYMDAHRRVFSSVADSTEDNHVDVVPNLHQKERLGYLFTERKNLLRKLQYLDDSDENVYYEPIKSWDFEKQEDCYMWGKLAKSTDPVYDENEKALFGTLIEEDGHIKMLEFDENHFSADEADYLHVVMRVDDPAATTAQIYFKTNVQTEWSAERGTSFNIVGDGNYHEYYVDLSSITSWKGEILELRFDPLSIIGDYYIKKIEFVKRCLDNTLKFSIDNVEHEISQAFYERVGDEVYVAGNPTKGFYAQNQFYYEWNRWTGRMFIRTTTGTEFVFTVGSDKALVDGIEKTLPKAIYLIDGLVALPMNFIYDNAGYNYTVDEDGSYYLEVVQGNIKEILDSRVPYEYEFKLNGDNEGWKISSGYGGVVDGDMVIEATHNGVRYDPQIILSNIQLDPVLYTSITVRIKPAYAGGSGNELAIYFVTSEDSEMNEAKSRRGYMTSSNRDEEGYHVVTIDMTANEAWKDTVTKLRIDPPGRPGNYKIDYIHLNIDEEYYQEYLKKQEELEKERAKLYLADSGEPFYIPNPDAEQDIDASVYGNANSKVSIVEDDLREGNKAFSVTTETSDKPVWTYFSVPTRFKKGVTYKVDFDYRVVGTTTGEEANNVHFAVNFKYADIKNGVVNAKCDHAITPSEVLKYTDRPSSADGWKSYSVTHTISTLSPSRSYDGFSIFTSPDQTNIVNYHYMIDNIKISVVGYEFETDGDYEGFKTSQSTSSVSGGNLNLTASVLATGKYDPQVWMQNMTLDTKIHTHINVRIKPAEAFTKNQMFAVYFATADEPGLSESKKVSVFTDSSMLDEDGYYNLKFDMTSNEKWTGTVKTIRFDPPDTAGTYYIDYIHV